MTAHKQMIALVETPFCKVLMLEPWNAPAGRYFISYRCLGDFGSVLGLPVIDEFATISSPIFFAPFSIMGKIYNVGISLGHKRDPEMGIDLGWPPLVVGYEGPVPELTTSWEDEVLLAIQNAGEKRSKGAGEQVKVDEYEVQRLQIGQCEVFATNAPLLPKQLSRVAQKSNAPFSIAFSSANRVTSPKNAIPITIHCVSEEILKRILNSLIH